MAVVVGILLIIAAIVGFMAVGMGDGDNFVKLTKAVMVGILAVFGVASGLGEHE